VEFLILLKKLIRKEVIIFSVVNNVFKLMKKKIKESKYVRRLFAGNAEFVSKDTSTE
jgi:hypothetical protein